MFADACEKAAKFTRPLIISTRQMDGKVNANCGTFIILNREGWIITAGHMFDSFVKFQGDQNKMKEVNELNMSRGPGSPHNTIRTDPEWLTNHSFWWAWDGVRLVEAFVDRQIDICIGRLEPFDPKWITEYPVFRDPESLRPGTSLCRLGFPFAQVESEFEDSSKAFRIKKGVLPLPFFPIEGMHTRNIAKGFSKEGNYEMLYVETSSPGLRGQSGGPIFDREGKLYAMQVQTAHMPLGFQPTAEYEGKRVVENQFINIGIGIHVKTIEAMLRDRNVRFQVEGESDGFRIIN